MKQKNILNNILTLISKQRATTTKHGNAREHTFRTNGKVVIVNGWRDVAELGEPPAAKSSKGKGKKKNAEEDETPLPPLSPGDTRIVQKAEVKEDKTKPPGHHNDASLLAAMEHAGREIEDEELARQMKGMGIGTPATRASIIERLLQVGYAQRKGKQLIATDKGVSLIAIMPQEIASPEMTGRWELVLEQITGGKQDAEKFMDSIRKFSTFLVNYARNNRSAVVFPDDGRRKKRSQSMVARGTLVDGCKCPVCKEGNVLEGTKGFFCSRSAEGCKFTIWKDCLTRGGGPELSAKLVQLVLVQQVVRGSTGVVMVDDRQIQFFPHGSEMATARRPLIYEKR